MQEIVINKDMQNTKIIALVENGILIEKYEERENHNRLEGNIYIGKIQNVLQGMQAAFVDIGENKNTFIHLKDILPKIDITKEKVENIEYKNIKEVVKPGMPILVQVKRDSTNKKGARVSTHISLVGRYFVLMPETNIVTISQKIEDEDEKNRLLGITRKYIGKNIGAIIRTSSNNKKEEELLKDLQSITKRWEKIKNEVTQKKKFPRIVEKNESIMKKIIIDTIDNNLSRIIVNNMEVYKEVKNIVKELDKDTSIEIVLKEKENILDLYDLSTQLEKAENRKVWLKCGGFITIDKTEALTAIDVNSGKYTGTNNLEQTVLKVNKEASQEIARQIRLRDIGGIIIIDYIDMTEEKHEQEIIDILNDNLKKDRSKTQVIGFTKLNLLEMTRKHMCSND